MKVEFFELIPDKFRKRSFVGSYPILLLKKGDSINFLFFGIALGHSLRHGGPGAYCLQPWVYEKIRGLDHNDHETDEQIMTLLTKHDTPKHVSAIDLIELINKLDNAESQEELDKIVDKFIQIINCFRLESTGTITLSNKNLLMYELVYDDVVRKRRCQIKSITEGLRKSGFLKYINRYPDLCRSIFVGSPGEALNAEILLTVLKKMEKIMIIKSRKP